MLSKLSFLKSRLANVTAEGKQSLGAREKPKSLKKSDLDSKMTIKERIEADLKAALLGGDKDKAMVLRGLKSSILNAEIAQGKRDTGLDEDSTVKLLFSEVKKRQEAIDIYKQADNQDKIQAEESEIKIINNYLPEQMGQDEVAKVVNVVVDETGADGIQQMGQVIKEVMSRTKGQADGSLVARLVKERLS